MVLSVKVQCVTHTHTHTTTISRKLLLSVASTHKNEREREMKRLTFIWTNVMLAHFCWSLPITYWTVYYWNTKNGRQWIRWNENCLPIWAVICLTRYWFRASHSIFIIYLAKLCDKFHAIEHIQLPSYVALYVLRECAADHLHQCTDTRTRAHAHAYWHAVCWHIYFYHTYRMCFSFYFNIPFRFETTECHETERPINQKCWFSRIATTINAESKPKRTHKSPRHTANNNANGILFRIGVTFAARLPDR